MDLIERLFRKHKFMRRSCMYWAMAMASISILNPSNYSDAKFAAVVGLVSVSIGLYQWDKKLERDRKAGGKGGQG